LTLLIPDGDLILMAGNLWLLVKDFKSAGGARQYLIQIFLSRIFLFRDFADRKIGLTIERQDKVD